MNKGVNRAIILGNVGQDPTIRHTPSGDAVANISIATTESWKGKDGTQQERAIWHKIAFFGKLAEIVAQYVKKGSKLYIEGSLRTRKWQGQDGQDRYSTEIVASEMQMLDSRGSQAGYDQSPPAQSTAADQQAPKQAAPQQQANDLDDQIPF